MVDGDNLRSALQGGGAVITLLGIVCLIVGWYQGDLKSYLVPTIIGGVLVGVGISAIIISYEMNETSPH